jgi:ElaA protein
VLTVSVPDVRVAPVTDLTPETLYRVLQLRVDVFVVEQACAYRELDGRDLDPQGRLLWIEDETGAVVATLRVVPDPIGARIGRVATAPYVRAQGHAARLVARALELTDAAGQDVALDAQAPLAGWYARFGFHVAGPEFVEDGIPHVPMTRRAGA